MRTVHTVAALREALGGAFDGREEVRGDGRGGVVGGAVLVGDRERAHAERVRQRAGGRERTIGAAPDGGARPGERGRTAGDRHQGMQAERLVRGEHAEVGGAGAVADEQAVTEGDGVRRGRDLAVGDAEEHDVRGRAIKAAPERAYDGMAGRADRTGERRAHAAAADDRDRAPPSTAAPGQVFLWGKPGGPLHISVQPPIRGAGRVAVPEA